jgi:hypothetical protein
MLFKEGAVGAIWKRNTKVMITVQLGHINDESHGNDNMLTIIPPLPIVMLATCSLLNLSAGSLYRVTEEEGHQLARGHTLCVLRSIVTGTTYHLTFLTTRCT